MQCNNFKTVVDAIYQQQLRNALQRVYQSKARPLWKKNLVSTYLGDFALEDQL